MAGATWGIASVAIVASMWSAMTLAMMLPSAAPMILTYAEIADTAARKGERIVSPFTLAAGYTLVWLGFAAAATLAQFVFTRAALLERRYGSGERIILGRDLHRRRRLSVLRAQARLPDAMPASVSVFLYAIGRPRRAACSGSASGRASIASAAAGR